MQIVSYLVVALILLDLSHVDAINEFEVCSQKDKGSVRLTGLNSSFVGYVQVCRNGHWTAVSFEAEEEWTKKNSIVTCKELGFIGAIIVMNKDRSSLQLASTTNPNSPGQYYSVECTGLEERLIDCNWSKRSTQLNRKDVIVLCKEALYRGEIVLVGINGQDNEGIVEIYNPLRTYRWSPICTNGWDDTDARVACKQLGFKGGSSTHYSPEQEIRHKSLPRKRYSHFGCVGSERELANCHHLGPYPYKCYSKYYAGVVCEGEAEDNRVLHLNVALLVFMMVISLLLIAILILILRCTLNRFGKKQNRNRSNDDHHASEEERPNQARNSNNRAHNNIVHTQLNLEMPYFSTSTIAPPTYQDTLLADQIVQAVAGGESEATSNLDDAQSTTSVSAELGVSDENEEVDCHSDIVLLDHEDTPHDITTPHNGD